MPDREPIISLSVGMPDHEKIVRAGGDAAWLWICGLAYARRQHNDGVIPEGQVTRLSDRKQPRRLAQILVRERLWHGTGHDCPRCPVPMPGSYVIHDYADWQQLAVEEAADEEAEAATRIAKMQGGAYGNHRRWHLGRGRTEPGCPFCDALLMNGNGSYPSSDSDSHDPSDPDRICDPSTESVATRIPIGLAMTGPLSPPHPPLSPA